MKRLLTTIMACLFALSANAGVLLTHPKFYDPENAGAKLCTFEAGGTTPKATYKERALINENSNPVALDADGLATVWGATNTDYKLVLLPSTYTDCTDITSPIWTMDNIRGWSESGDDLRSDLAGVSASTGGNLVHTQGYGSLGDAFPYVADPGATDHGDVTENGSIAKIEAAIDTDEQVIVVPGNNNYAFTTPATISANVVLDIRQGAIISGTIAFADSPDKQIIAQDGQQIFAAGAAVTFDNGGTAHPEWWGGVSDGVTDTGQYVALAQDSIPRGVIKYGAGPYRFTATNGVECKSNVAHVGIDSKTQIIHEATISGTSNGLFYINDCTNVAIRNFCVTASTLVNHVAIDIKGTAEDIFLEDLHLHDHKNHAIQYADNDVDPLTAYFKNIHLTRIKIDGVANPGISSGINFFPQAESGGKPASFGLFMASIYIDVSNDSDAVTDHGDACLKMNNTDGVYLDNLHLIGGTTQALGITNGTINLEATNIVTRKSDNGIGVAGGHPTLVDKPVADINITNWTHYNDGATASDNGMLFTGDVHRMNVTNFSTDMRIYFYGREATDVQEDITFSNGTLNGTVFSIGATVDPDVERLRMDNITFIGGAGTTTGKLSVGNATRTANNSTFSRLFFHESDNTSITNHGDDNLFEVLYCIDGNPDNDASRAAFYDYGNRTKIRGLDLLGGTQQFDLFYYGDTVDSTVLSNLSGSPDDTDGLNFVTCVAEAPVGDVVVFSETLDLSGAATDNVEFFAAQNYYITSVSIVYTEASSADVGVKIRIGNTTTTNYNLDQDSEINKAIGYSKLYINTADYTSGRHNVNRGEFLTIGTVGGKTGVGAVRVTVHLVQTI